MYILSFVLLKNLLKLFVPNANVFKHIQGFPNFFQNTPFTEIKKAMAPSNMITQKLPLKTPKTFFCSS